MALLALKEKTVNYMGVVTGESDGRRCRFYFFQTRLFYFISLFIIHSIGAVYLLSIAIIYRDFFLLIVEIISLLISLITLIFPSN